MSKKRTVRLGERVVLVGRHPWCGYSGEVIQEPDMAGGITVRLDNDIEAMAWPRQWAPFERTEGQ